MLIGTHINWCSITSVQGADVQADSAMGTGRGAGTHVPGLRTSMHGGSAMRMPVPGRRGWRGGATTRRGGGSRHRQESRKPRGLDEGLQFYRRANE